MKREGLKRLELWLPVNHPVWSLPLGTRAAVAKEWLKIGARLATLEEAVTRLEQKLIHERSVSSQTAQSCIDVNAFFEI